jgi:post-segregation antitoxin (ccd killing protein)
MRDMRVNISRALPVTIAQALREARENSFSRMSANLIIDYPAPRLLTVIKNPDP